jgi:hypothetical protein
MNTTDRGPSWLKWLQFFAIMTGFLISLVLARRVLAFASPYYGWMVMSAVLALGAFGRKLFLLRLPPSLELIQAWERRGSFYRQTGVVAFGVILRRTPLRHLQPLVYLQHQSGEMALVLAQVKGAEAVHFWAGLALMPWIGFAVFHNEWVAFVLLAAIQLVLNLYPMLHLRWVRCRMETLFDRMASKRTRRGRTTQPCTGV